ncbi:Helix-turn-helix domain protein [compost metagenome]
MNPLDHIMGVNEAAELWGLSPGTIKNYCADGKVKAIKIGNQWVLDKNQPSPSQPDHPNNWRGKK